MSDVKSLIEKLASTLNVRVRYDVLGSALTTFSIGGALSYLFEPDTEAQLTAIVRAFNAESIPFEILGAGSNLLIDDSGVKKAIIRLGAGFRTVEKIGSAHGKESFRVGGAYSTMSLSRQLCSDGFSGLEFAGGIPGSVGGAVRMNAGAHGGETSSLVQRVKFIDRLGEIVELESRQLSFEYRRCSVPKGAVIFECQLSLTSSDPEKTQELRAKNLAERKKRQPLSAASAGSVFKNPSATESAGYLIERCGLKGKAIGGAMISELHGNWIINPDKRALAADVRGLIAAAREQVQAKFGVSLEQEIVEW